MPDRKTAVPGVAEPAAAAAIGRIAVGCEVSAAGIGDALAAATGCD